MGDLVLKGATSGQITVTPTAIAGTNTLTLPAATGNIITSADSGTVTQAMLASNVAGNGPAFYAYASATQSVSNNTDVKLQINTKETPDPDTSNLFNTSTYRFTPNVAGYYQINGTYCPSGASSGVAAVKIFKNGSQYKYGLQVANGTGNIVCGVSSLVYLNGTTDYVELYGYQNSGGALTNTVGSSLCYFQGYLVRAA